MTIPASITTALDSLESQVNAAAPLADASQATLAAIRLNTAALVINIQSALTATSVLDTYVASTDPSVLIGELLTLTTAATDQAKLSLMRGVVGRAASNLDQLSFPTGSTVPLSPFVPQGIAGPTSGIALTGQDNALLLGGDGSLLLAP